MHSTIMKYADYDFCILFWSESDADVYFNGKFKFFLMENFIVGILYELGWLCGKFKESL